MKVFNSKSLRVEEFVPQEKNNVTMYVCGITPYDTTHLGHAFLYVFFDAVFRYLQYKKFKVVYTQNVTDIDDDILKRAKNDNRDWRELGDFWTNKFLKDLKDLNLLMPTHYVRATDSIPTIIKIIEGLVKNKFAYAKEGNVYFEVSKFIDYGKLSKLTRSEMVKISKERGADPDDPLKKDSLDFILWQKSKPDEPFWNAPWSKGRPGWHIECSAMIQDRLGEQIDIHGGGADLIFPHHESEIAQSESYSGKTPFVKYWMHASMLMYQGEKMSKSLGNLVMVSDLLKKYSPNAIRWMLLSHHYRQEWEYDEKELQEAQEKVKHMQENKNTDVAEQIIENDFNFADSLNSLSPKLFKVLGFVV